MSGDENTKPRPDDSSDLASPSKSSRLFFMNRHSNYSIESISEEPEIQSQASQTSPSKHFEPIQISKSPARSFNIMPTPSKSIFASKPTFTRSKSSLHSNDDKPTTIDDFADTDSSEDSHIEGHTEDISSIILSYERSPTSKKLKSIPPEDFIFKESFDDSDLKNLTSPEPQSLTSTLEAVTKPKIPSETNPLVIPSVSSPSSTVPTESTTKIASKSVETPEKTAQSSPLDEKESPAATTSTDSSKDKLKERKKVLSASSNIDLNRTSLYNMTTVDVDHSYPEPTVTPSETPTKGSLIRHSDTTGRSRESRTVLEDITDEIDVESISLASHPNPTKDVSAADSGSLGSKSMPATASKRDTRSSLSSGELLSKLEYYYDASEATPPPGAVIPNKPSTIIRKPFVPPQHPSSIEPRETGGDLTAGVDSSTELPITLYKVHDKNYDEGNLRWSVYEFNRISASKSKADSSGSSAYSDALNEMAANSSQEKAVAFSPAQPETAITKKPRSSASSLHSKKSEVAMSSLAGKPITANEAPSQSIPGLPVSLSQHSLPEPAVLTDTVVKNQQEDMFQKPKTATKTPSEFKSYYDNEKNIEYNPEAQYYSWMTFAGMIVLGLVVCPIYFSIALGLFDHSKGSNYYSGLYYYHQEKQGHSSRGKKFSKKQKIISLVIGLIWVATVLAMIGVGIGVGLSRE